MIAYLFSHGLTLAFWLSLVVFLYLIPGFTVFLFFAPEQRSNPLEVQLSISFAIGLCIYPLLLLWSDLIGFHLGIVNALLPPVLGVIYLSYYWWRNRKKIALPNFREIFITNLWINSSFLLILASLIFSRFWVIRNLPLPMWGDSVHHSLIVQLILNHGGLFHSWQPYAELESLSYHFGFHSAVAMLAWLSGLSAAKATLVFGQIINIFAVLSLSALSWKISSGKRWVGIFTMVIAGFVLSMPMFYTNWSRYTQLCGQVVLPVVAYFLWILLEKRTNTTTNKSALENIRNEKTPKEQLQRIEKNRKIWIPFNDEWKLLILVGILIGGLGLIHYRVIIFMFGCIPILLFITLTKKYWFQQVLDLFWGGVIGGVLFMPWFIKIYGGRLYQNFVRGITTPVSALSSFSLEYNAIGSITSYLPAIVWVLLVIAFAYGLFHREKGIVFLLGWWGLILILANPAWIGLPGTGILSNFAVFIAFYIPAALVLGSTIEELMEPYLSRFPSFTNVFITFLIIVTIGITIKYRIRDIQPNQFALATQSDLVAMDWIKENTPRDSRILVNSFFAYGGSTIVGSDGGWWIPLLTERKISVPPMPYTSEVGPIPNYREYVNSLRQLIEEKGYTDSSVIAELKKRGYQYAYIGDKQGRVNYSGPVIMDAKAMIASGYYFPVYHKNNIWIFEIR